MDRAVKAAMIVMIPGATGECACVEGWNVALPFQDIADVEEYIGRDPR